MDTQAESSAPSASRPSFVWPIAIGILSTIAMVVILNSGSADDIFTPGILPAGIGVCAAILPLYILGRWYERAFAAMQRTQGAGKLRYIAIIIVFILPARIHGGVIGSLLVTPIPRGHPSTFSNVDTIVFLLMATIAADMLLYISFEACRCTARKAPRIVLSILTAVLAAVCIGCYAFLATTFDVL